MPIKLNRWIEPAPNLVRETPPLTADLPTFAPGSVPEHHIIEPGLPIPASRGDGRVEVLGQMAYQIRETGSPAVPRGVPATLVGTLAGGNHVYLLGGTPDWGVDTAYFFMLKQEPDGWTATPICHGAWRSWAWPGTLQQAGPDPVAVCGSNDGSGSVLTLAAYRGNREVLRVAGLEEGYYQILPDANGGPPTIVVYGALSWLHHKLDPSVLERFTFTWQGDAYGLAKRERMADWVYHAARFKQFVATGDLERAAKEMVESPPGGLTAYLQKNAPDLMTGAGWVWTTSGYPTPPRGSQAYFHQANVETGPWFRFDVGPDGRILAVSQVAEPPKQP
ncbi:MAG: hypothetical protein JWN15_269 [Firmicutes bacterium]|nr:hypothetical protein [Bacillota bacterium]